MADFHKERIVVSGEIVQLRDPSDQVTYTQTVGLIKDFSDSKPNLVEIKPLDNSGAHIEPVETTDKPRVNVSNIAHLPLPVFAARLREQRLMPQAKKPSTNPLKFFKNLFN